MMTLPFNGVRAIVGIADLPEGLRIVLPWPPQGLNPNRRHIHPAKKGAIAMRYRHECWAETLSLLGVGAGKRLLPAEGRLPVRLDLFPPNTVTRDDDNAEAAFKAGRDGVAAALGIDDHRIKVVRRELRDEPRACVVMTFLNEDKA